MHSPRRDDITSRDRTARTCALLVISPVLRHTHVQLRSQSRRCARGSCRLFMRYWGRGELARLVRDFASIWQGMETRRQKPGWIQCPARVFNALRADPALSRRKTGSPSPGMCVWAGSRLRSVHFASGAESLVVTTRSFRETHGAAYLRRAGAP